MFSAVAEQMGLSYDTAVKVSCGFGGGMYLGSVCGAVTGGIMGIGLKHGGVGMQAGAKTAAMGRELADRFKAQHKSINCPDLIGVDLSKVDLSNPASLKAATDAAGGYEKVFANCSGFVKDATTIVTELLNG